MPDDKNQPLRRMEKDGAAQNIENIEKERIEQTPGLTRPETLIESAPEHREKENTAEAIEDKGQEGEPGVSLVVAGRRDSQSLVREKAIEKILEKDLAGLYVSLPPQKQREFKMAGEATARKISELITKTKFKVGKVIDLIKKWLSLLPGVNKFFLEQEAKLKADEIMKMERTKTIE
jgi:hypothetical protein